MTAVTPLRSVRVKSVSRVSFAALTLLRTGPWPVWERRCPVHLEPLRGARLRCSRCRGAPTFRRMMRGPGGRVRAYRVVSWLVWDPSRRRAEARVWSARDAGGSASVDAVVWRDDDDAWSRWCGAYGPPPVREHPGKTAAGTPRRGSPTPSLARGEFPPEFTGVALSARGPSLSFPSVAGPLASVTSCGSGDGDGDGVGGVGVGRIGRDRLDGGCV